MGALLDIARTAAAFNGAPVIEKVAVSPSPGQSAFDIEYFEERAAIREFDGGFTQQEAERLALIDLQTRTIN